MAVKKTRAVVDELPVKFDTPVAAAIVTERTNVIEKAIREDKQAAPAKAKKAGVEYQGPKAKKLTSQASFNDFKKLCTFLQTPWFSSKMDPNLLTQAQARQDRRRARRRPLQQNGTR